MKNCKTEKNNVLKFQITKNDMKSHDKGLYFKH